MIDFCQIYLPFGRVSTLISDVFHGDRAHPGSNCLCFSDEVLWAAHRYRESQDNEIPFEHNKVVRMCQNAMIERLGPIGAFRVDCIDPMQSKMQSWMRFAVASASLSKTLLL